MNSEPCFVCGRALTKVSENEQSIQCHGGLVFSAGGNYGSTVFDRLTPGGSEFLEILVCDDCVVAAAQPRLSAVEQRPWGRVMLRRVQRVRQQTVAYEPFTPGGQE